MNITKRQPVSVGEMITIGIYKRLSWPSLASPDPDIFAGAIIDNIESYSLDFDGQKGVLRRNNRQKWDIN